MMKSHLWLPGFLLIAFAFTGLLQAQKSDLENTLLNTERQLWEAWKNKDAATFDKTLDPNAVNMSDKGLEDRTATIKEITSGNCQVSSYTLSDAKVTQIDKDTVLLTYKAHQDATCDGKKVPPIVNASSIYEKHGDKWQPIFHQETPLPETAMGTQTPSSR